MKPGFFLTLLDSRICGSTAPTEFGCQKTSRRSVVVVKAGPSGFQIAGNCRSLASLGMTINP